MFNEKDLTLEQINELKVSCLNIYKNYFNSNNFNYRSDITFIYFSAIWRKHFWYNPYETYLLKSYYKHMLYFHNSNRVFTRKEALQFWKTKYFHYVRLSNQYYENS